MTGHPARAGTIAPIHGDGPAAADDAGDLPGFCRGTLIRTEAGEVAVERLRVGDRLVMESGTVRPLRRIERRRLHCLPVLVMASALADGVPSRDLLVSPLLGLLLDGWLVPAARLVNGRSIVQAATGAVDHVRLGLDEHDALLAEATPASCDVACLEEGEALRRLRARLAARAGSMRAATHGLEGHLDEAGHAAIRGWAREASGGVARLRILDDGRTLGIVTADLPRPDLAAAGIGDGSHGFAFVMPGGLDPRVRHVIRVQHVLDGIELDGSPFLLDVAAEAGDDGATCVMPVLVGADAEDGRHGHLDRVERGLVRGWAWNSLDPDCQVAVQIFANGHLLVRVVANVYRADLAAVGIGRGRHGFAVELPDVLSLRVRHVLQARIEDGGRELLGSPVAIEPADAFDGALEKVVVDAVDGLAGASERERVLRFLLSEAGRVRQQLADGMAGRAGRESAERRRRALGPLADAPSPRRALVIDERMPSPDRDAGSQAVLSHMSALQALGFAVSLAAMDGSGADAATAAWLSGRDITVCAAPFYSSVEDVLRRQGGCFDVVYLHRIAVASAYMALARRFMPAARLLYSVADLHHLRLSREARAEGRPELLGLSQRIRLEECTAAWQADAVLTHSVVEADLLRRMVPAASVHEVPWAVGCAPGTDGDAGDAAFGSRAGVAFVGHWGHRPNVDAATWLVEAVMPLVWARDPHIPCLLAGSEITPRIHALGRPGVEIHGQVGDLAALWRRVRLSVAPLRFGAGIKGKVLNSLAAGVPCVMTPLAAEGLALVPPLQALVAETEEALSDRICRLHADAAMHAAARAAGLELIRRRHAAGVVEDALRAAIDGCRGTARASAA